MPFVTTTKPCYVINSFLREPEVNFKGKANVKTVKPCSKESKVTLCITFSIKNVLKMIEY